MVNITFEHTQPGSPSQWYDLGCSLRQRALFGDALNAFSQAVSMADRMLADTTDKVALSEDDSSGTGESGLSDSEMERLMAIRAKALASIELIKEINGFVNVDLMNP